MTTRRQRIAGNQAAVRAANELIYAWPENRRRRIPEGRDDRHALRHCRPDRRTIVADHLAGDRSG